MNILCKGALSKGEARRENCLNKRAENDWPTSIHMRKAGRRNPRKILVTDREEKRDGEREGMRMTLHG